MRWFILHIIFLLSVTGQPAYSLPLSCSEHTCKIVLLGNSYSLFNHLPSILRNLARYSDKVVYIDEYLVENTGLSDWVQSTEVENLLYDKEYDYAILQGSGAGTAYPDYYQQEKVFESLQKLKEKIIENWDSTNIVFIMPWAFEDGMTWLGGWTDDYKDMQLKIYDNTLRYCNELDIIIAPIGWAWLHVLEEKNYPLHYLHMEDYNHPSPAGSYLMACVVYSVIFLESPAGITYFALLPEQEGKYFQKIASDIVFRNPTNWNLLDVDIPLIVNDIKTERLHLNQNYPNPFNTLTTIEFETEKEGFIELALFNEYGHKCYEIINEYMMPGKYSVIFEGTCLPEGIYYYSLKTGYEMVTRRMILIH